MTLPMAKCGNCSAPLEGVRCGYCGGVMPSAAGLDEWDPVHAQMTIAARGHDLHDLMGFLGVWVGVGVAAAIIALAASL